MKKLIIIGVLLALTIGVAVATDVDNQLKTPDDYGDIQNGCATYRTYNDRAIYVDKLFASITADYLTNSSDYKVYSVGDNIYYMKDDTFKLYGYFEVVEINGNKYMISVLQGTHLSPSEEHLLLDHLKEFNKINNLTPIVPS